jgi:transposase
MCPYTYYDVMRKSKDPRYLRHQIVLAVEKQGIKATARAFGCSRNTVRKWYRRWREQGYKGLESQSRRPLRSLNATPADEREQLLKLKKKYKRLGADAVRVLEGLSRSPRTIRKVWREQGVSSRKRRKKHQTKQNLREVKRQWRLFQQIDEDTKYLNDIPEYYFQMMRKGLPKMQFTARDVSSGLMYMGFAQERSAINATLFARYLNKELQACGVDISRTTRQTDNGSEYINHIHAKEPGPYTLTVEEVPGQIHRTIPPGAHTFQSDVETVHNLVEVEFYEIEHFEDIDDFMNKAFAYQIFFNLFRPNSYKENKTPWQLAEEKQPGLSKQIAMIPPVYIEDLMNNDLEISAMGGHDVSSVPYPPYLILNPT